MFSVAFVANTTYHHALMNNENLKQAVIDGLSPCMFDHKGCEYQGKGWTVKVCGEEIHNICGGYYLIFKKPSAEVIKHIKDVIQVINDMAV